MSTVLFSPSYSWRFRLFAQGYLQGLSRQRIFPAIDCAVRFIAFSGVLFGNDLLSVLESAANEPI